MTPAVRTPPAPELVSLSEAARRLSVGKRTLWRWIARGDLRIVRLGHGRGVIRVPVTELARLIAEGTPD